MSKVKFELEFSTAVSNTNYKVSGQDYSTNNKWMNELHLNMNADINDETTNSMVIYLWLKTGLKWVGVHLT